MFHLSEDAFTTSDQGFVEKCLIGMKDKQKNLITSDRGLWGRNSNIMDAHTWAKGVVQSQGFAE